MSPTVITLEVSSPEQERLLRQFHALMIEMEALALSAPDGHTPECLSTGVALDAFFRHR